MGSNGRLTGGGGGAFAAFLSLALLLILGGWVGIQPPRLLPTIVLIGLLATPFAIQFLHRSRMYSLLRLIAALSAILLVATLATAFTVSRRAFSGCQEVTPITDSVIEITRGYDFFDDSVVCHFRTEDGRTGEERVRSWTVLAEYFES